MKHERLYSLISIIAIAAASRLLPHPDNVAPIAAIALFSGAMLAPRWLAFVVPFAALLASDAVLGFYEGMWVVYAAFAAAVCLGFALRGRATVTNTVAMTLASSVLFFLATNNPFLVNHSLYPQTAEGMMQAYTAAVPFFRSSVLGDLFYSGLLFGGFALAQRRFPRLLAV